MFVIEAFPLLYVTIVLFCVGYISLYTLYSVVLANDPTTQYNFSYTQPHTYVM